MTQTAKTVTHGQWDGRPAVTFLPSEHYRRFARTIDYTAWSRKHVRERPYSTAHSGWERSPGPVEPYWPARLKRVVWCHSFLYFVFSVPGPGQGMFEHVWPNRGPHTLGVLTRVPKILWVQSCVLVKIRKTFQKKTIIESMHCCIRKLMLKLYDKMNRTRLFGLSFWSCGLAPHIFPNRAPKFVNPALSSFAFFFA